MDVIHERCAGLDVHKRMVVAAVILSVEGAEPYRETRSWGTMTEDLVAMAEWLSGLGVTHVAMESTGVYWKPVYNVLEDGDFELLLVNAQHLKAVPGRKTDVKDAEWIADLLRHGLLRPSFVPEEEQRELRELTRSRGAFVRERTALVNRVQKVLEGGNIKLASVASDVMGVSGRAMLAALVDGQASPEDMAELAHGKLRNKRDELERALSGRFQPHQRFILAELLAQIDALDEAIARFDEQIQIYRRPFEREVQLLDTIPGVGPKTAEVIVAEVGTDMSRFPSAQALASWAGVVPGNNESAGKQRSGRARPGDKALKVALVEAAHAAARANDNYLSAQYHRIAARRGTSRAGLAVGHSILVIAYHMMQRQRPYEDLGPNYFDLRQPQATAKRLLKRLTNLGFQVELHPPNPAPA